MKKIICSLLLLCTLSFASQAQSKEYKKLVKEYMETTNALAQFNANIVTILDMFKGKETYSEIPDKFWVDFQAEIEKTSETRLIDMFVEIYYKYFTEEDLKEIIAFYKTPIGKKLLQNNPAIIKDAMNIGKKWGEEIAEQVIEKINKEIKKND
ncbi:MAG: DUF2059 domain-containing protein [Bacteroidota bacterium]